MFPSRKTRVGREILEYVNSIAQSKCYVKRVEKI